LCSGRERCKLECVKELRRLLAPRNPSRPAAAALGLAVAGATTFVLLLLPDPSTTTGALVYALAVMVATSTGGMGAGLLCAVVSFVALNFFFTPPFYTLRVDKAQDIVALAVFLVVATIIGFFFSTVISQRAQAERREREVRLLQQLATRLLSGEPIEQELRRFATSMVHMLQLEECSISTELTRGPIVAGGGKKPTASGPSLVTPMVARGREVGRIAISVGAAHPPLSLADRETIELVAGQMALALDGVRMGLQARSAQVEAERNKLRAALFSSVTHDLRTPLTSITASASSLLDREALFSVDESRTLLATIQSEAARLNRLVGNLMHLSQVQAGALVPQRVPVAVDEIVERVVARLKPQLGDHSVCMMVRDDVPDVSADIVQLDQLITNVVENAVKFSPPGSDINISVARWLHSVRVSIADRGPGIPAEERERVFEAFVRGGDGSDGSGLGLAIARAVVLAHDGRIWIEGTPGGGTTVMLELPAVQ
jgi:two-component system, OmpR family, sensor histidine kinase KdpD